MRLPPRSLDATTSRGARQQLRALVTVFKCTACRVDPAPGTTVLHQLTIAGRVALGGGVVVLVGSTLLASAVAMHTTGDGAAWSAFVRIGGLGLVLAATTFVVTRWLLRRELGSLHQLAAALDGVELDGSEVYRNLPARGPVEVERIVEAWNGFALRFDIYLHGLRSSTFTLHEHAQLLIAGGSNAEGGTTTAALQEVSAHVLGLATTAAGGHQLALRVGDLTGVATRRLAQALGPMQRVDAAIAQLEATSRNAQVVLKAIDDAAIQTHLLALAAAIEAARAGEPSAGLAVVADEVRALARRSADAARSSSDLVAQSVRDADHVVGLVRESQTVLDALDETLHELQANASDLGTTSATQVEATATTAEHLSITADQALVVADELSRSVALVAEAAAELGAGTGSAPEADDQDVIALAEVTQATG